MIFGCTGLNNCPEKTLPRKRVITGCSKFKVQGSRFQVPSFGVRRLDMGDVELGTLNFELGTLNLELGTF
jgi:hypothetical protein